MTSPFFELVKRLEMECVPSRNRAELSIGGVELFSIKEFGLCVWIVELHKKGLFFAAQAVVVFAVALLFGGVCF
ncbi:hypothetical protein [Burkholderia sp. Ac-20365]|uniref:hypothetical protein n=1 Tax=Burkholderia sp. Ac-20365 TaxID=2703897 RepID=UPI00197C4F31|nr:hypothetical protein [Burkholderia sp. Ac-20365]MBN3762636.1 hypothetical protein [Burkholderia sp. Ac-20365]